MSEKTVMVICEKPDAGRRLAVALDSSHKPKKILIDQPFYEARQQGQRIIICSALGHLYGVDSKDDKTAFKYPIWDYQWKPLYRKRGKKRQKTLIDKISKLARGVDEFVNACDFDIEGSLIGYMILQYACNNAHLKAKRMKFSTLTSNEVNKAFNALIPEIDFSIVEAGKCRHEIDWLYGINLSRALMGALKTGGDMYSPLSIGRVQGPTLNYIVSREAEIKTFNPTPYWTINARIVIDGNEITAVYKEGRIKSRGDAERVKKDCQGKTGVIDEIQSFQNTIKPPFPFDLTTLQSEGFKHFGFSPRTTLDIAERLYLNALISYPRTSSQRLPKSIGYRDILNKIRCFKQYSPNVSTLLTKTFLKPHEGIKEDPAHPAVYPTGDNPSRKLKPEEKKIFDLIIKRFLAVFGDPAIRRKDKAVININSYTFFVLGSKILKMGWIPLYRPYARIEEEILPKIFEGQEAFFKSLKIEKKFTQPPPRYNPSSLIRLMEKKGIGTKATRTDIIYTLYRRGYLKGKRIMATPLASDIIDVFKKICPSIISVKLTHDIEKAMEKIEDGEEKRETLIHKTISNLKPVMDNLHQHQEEIGRKLTETLKEMRKEKFKLKTLCPQCGLSLRLIKSKRTKKRFIGCSGYEKGCQFSLPLPQTGKISFIDRLCKKCGFQMIMLKVNRIRQPLFSCPQCFEESMNKETKIEFKQNNKSNARA